MNTGWGILTRTGWIRLMPDGKSWDLSSGRGSWARTAKAVPTSGSAAEDAREAGIGMLPVDFMKIIFVRDIGCSLSGAGIRYMKSQRR